MMKNRLILLSIGLLYLLLTTGCSTKNAKEVVEDLDYGTPNLYATDSQGNPVEYDTYYHTGNPKGIIGASYKATDGLLERAKQIHLYKNKPVLVASFVNIDDLQKSSTFGRMIAEQMASRIAQHGLKVVEMKMRGSIFIQEGTGELMLSRELRNISLQHDAFAVLVGTYAEGKRRVYVTAKLVHAEDDVILASYDYELPIGPDTKSLLKDKQQR